MFSTACRKSWSEKAKHALGIAAGYFAKKVNSLTLGTLAGLGIGLLLAFLVAAMPNPEGKQYYFEIMLPGSILGAVVGFATQKYQPAKSLPPAGAPSSGGSGT